MKAALIVVAALLLLGIPFVVCTGTSSNFRAEKKFFEVPIVQQARLNVRDALRDGAKAQRAHHREQGTFTDDRDVITSGGRYTGVEIEVAYADADRFCIEAAHDDLPTSRHITDRLDRPKKGECPPAPL